MAKSDIGNEETTSEEIRKARIRSQIAALKIEKESLEKEKKAIEEAMEQVNALSSSSTLSKASNSFTWIVNNMDMYWNATDSNARETVKDTLTKVSKECGSSGKLLSQVGTVMAKAEEKILELTDKIEKITLEIASLEASLNVSVA